VDDQTREERIRQWAYRLWREEGCPEGRADAHWDMATELVAIEESQKDTLQPNPTQAYEENPTTEPIEPLIAVENSGSFPTLTDEDEEKPYPSRENFAEADEPPLAPPEAKPRRKPAAPRKKRKSPA
jgi:hypothetical protein